MRAARVAFVFGSIASAVAASAALGGGLSCGDPVHDARVDALGGEAPGVSPGPTHRPGQPCLTCHGGSGPADVELAAAGTIYQVAYDPTNPKAPPAPAVGATVILFDATEQPDGGTPVTATTNAAGNFYVPRSVWSPIFPLHDVSVNFPGLALPTPMNTNIGRDGECALCHFDPPANGSHGHVYLVSDPADLPGAATP